MKKIRVLGIAILTAVMLCGCGGSSYVPEVAAGSKVMAFW